MKRLFIFFVILLVIPFISNAQQTSTSMPVLDGSSESSYVRRERIRGWRQQSSALQQQINTLSNTAVLSLPIPILFGIGLKDFFLNFGDSRDGGARTHEGEDIMAVKGTPVVSPTSAIVLRVGTGSTEGNYVYTANPGGETFVYMHLDRIGEGVVVGVVLETGSLIGYVGNTGNASGGAAHLHFEIHNSDRVAIDPFPRLSVLFGLQEKITYLTKILTQTSDSITLANFLVLNFRGTFNTAITQSITLPVVISNALSSVPNTTTPSTSSLPQGDLTIGSRGIDVTNLQKYLILKSAGAEAVRLASAGATGYFGVLTQSAVMEYQIAMRIIPANGYYGSATRVSVIAGGGGSTTPPPVTPIVGNSIARNLYRSLSGEDVRTLQKFLNNQGFTVALSGFGSLGNETTYFGGATEASVIKFQIANGISPAIGYVGPITRTFIASLLN